MKRNYLFLSAQLLLSGVAFFHAEARYYEARVGRWLSVDPLAEKYLSFSPYSYALCNPINYRDPDGRKVELHKSAQNSKAFMRVKAIYDHTTLGAKQWSRFEKDDKIDVIYAVGDLYSSYGGTIGGHTRWEIGSENSPGWYVGSPWYGIEDQLVTNWEKKVIVIFLDEKTLKDAKPEDAAEKIYHEGKAHIEYYRDLNDLTGLILGDPQTHTKYGTDGVQPIRPGSDADKFQKQAKKATQKMETTEKRNKKKGQEE
jgi:RHS repeat-associated protein